MRKQVVPVLIWLRLYTLVYYAGKLVIYVLFYKHARHAKRITQVLGLFIYLISNKYYRGIAIHRVRTNRTYQLEACDHRQVSAADYEIEMFDSRG